ncbi:LemA family protein [Dietzia sp. DQ11-38-2]|uniref:NUDIX hydrolase n=1 Tax=Dietzia sp. DQ11-38-2 TaxID=2711155 RepID=UPI0015FAFD47|nr:NUDIX hydrolase [Dietzia sp. DQ11-38-2]MBB1026150.1 LemA family protein [Dietzia sp. DQ11-38-2]
MSAEVVLVVVVLALLLIAALITAYVTAHRLDRLHIRTDLARAALIGALERRHTVTAAIIAELGGRDPVAAQRLSHALVRARAHPSDTVTGTDPRPEPAPDRPGRSGRAGPPGPPGHGGRPPEDGSPDTERAENSLGTLLAGLDVAALPADLAAELEDVTDRVAMARSFYNDAVRDTRNLREQGTVRAFRLAGRAPMPDYVELVDHPPAGG